MDDIKYITDQHLICLAYTFIYLILKYSIDERKLSLEIIGKSFCNMTCFPYFWYKLLTDINYTCIINSFVILYLSFSETPKSLCTKMIFCISYTFGYSVGTYFEACFENADHKHILKLYPFVYIEHIIINSLCNVIWFSGYWKNVMFCKEHEFLNIFEIVYFCLVHSKPESVYCGMIVYKNLSKKEIKIKCKGSDIEIMFKLLNSVFNTDKFDNIKFDLEREICIRVFNDESYTVLIE